MLLPQHPYRTDSHLYSTWLPVFLVLLDNTMAAIARVYQDSFTKRYVVYAVPRSETWLIYAHCAMGTARVQRLLRLTEHSRRLRTLLPRMHKSSYVRIALFQEMSRLNHETSWNSSTPAISPPTSLSSSPPSPAMTPSEHYDSSLSVLPWVSNACL